MCTVTSTPAPTITWWYRGLFINNGSTMVSDIGHVSRAATAANFEHNFGHYYGQIFHLSSSKSRLSRSRWSRFHSFQKVINLNVGWFLNPAQFPRRLLLTKRSRLFSNITRE